MKNMIREDVKQCQAATNRQGQSHTASCRDNIERRQTTQDYTEGKPKRKKTSTQKVKERNGTTRNKREAKKRLRLEEDKGPDPRCGKRQ